MTDFGERLLIFNVPVIILALAKHVIDSNRDQIKHKIYHLQRKTNCFFKYITVSNLQRLA